MDGDILPHCGTKSEKVSWLVEKPVRITFNERGVFTKLWSNFVEVLYLLDLRQALTAAAKSLPSTGAFSLS